MSTKEERSNWTAKVVPLWEQDDAIFVEGTGEERLAALYEVSGNAWILAGKTDADFRLRRDVVRVFRRGS